MIRELRKIVEQFKNKKIAVIGDLMLDHYIFGSVRRVSSEAPVSIVEADKEDYVPGGAGNTAFNIRALGANVFIVGAVGKDREGERLSRELENKGIDTAGIMEISSRPTTQKIRVIVQGQQVVRIDRESKKQIDSQRENRAINLLCSRIKDFDGLVISDYQKGFITEKMAQNIIKLANENQRPIVGDSKSKNISHFKGITVLTPNEEEALRMTGSEKLIEAGRAIQRKLGSNVIITQGAEGMTLFEKEKTVKHFPTKAKKVFDVTGAGDTVAASIVLVLASGANLKQAVIIANYAAGIVVAKLGTASVSLEELKSALRGSLAS